MTLTALASLEPVLLRGALQRARDLPAERRARVLELHRASRRRSLAAREHREPELLPIALVLGREALLLSAEALRAARGAQGALAPGEVWETLQDLRPDLSEDLRGLLASGDPAFPDRLALDVQRRLVNELEDVLSALEERYEARTPRQVALAAALRIALVLGSLIASGLLLLGVTNPP